MARTEETIPALIRCSVHLGGLQIAALTLLDRLVVAMHRAGCHPIWVECDGPLPRLQRSQALGIQVEPINQPPKPDGPVVLAECRMLVQTVDVRSVVQKKARLVDRDGTPLPIGLVPSMPRESWSDALNLLPTVSAVGVCGLVSDKESAQPVTRRLWDSLGSSSDGLVDTYFNRPLGRYLSKILIHTPVTPNQVTVVSALIGLVAAWFMAQGEHSAVVVGSLLLQLSALVDCVDGDIARVVFKESPLGKWLDIGLDQVVHVAVFGGITYGLIQQGEEGPIAWLGASAVAGAVIAFPVVIWARRLADREKDGRLERFLDAASTRDFTVLIVALAVIDRLEWFLWLTAITVHFFWIAVLIHLIAKLIKARRADRPVS